MAPDLPLLPADPAHEDALMLQARQGDEQALAELIRLTQSMLFGYLARLTEDSRAAEDLFQDTWLKVMKALPAYRPRERFRSWLLTIAHHTAMRYLSQRARLPASLTPSQPDGPDPLDRLADPAPHAADGLLRQEREAWLTHRLASLPPDLREVVLLRIEHGLSFKEIARVTGVSVNTALGRMRYAVLHLQKLLDPPAEEHSKNPARTINRSAESLLS